MNINIEDLRTNSIQWLEKGEIAHYDLSPTARKKEMERYNSEVEKYDADVAWALYCHPNKTEYLQRAIEYLELKQHDVLLDIGTGDGRLSIMALQQAGIKEAIAIEWSKEWVKTTNEYINKNGGFPENMIYEQNTYQDFVFPERITKCIFLAHHNGEITKLNIIKKLSKTKCKLFVHNFRKQGGLLGERFR